MQLRLDGRAARRHFAIMMAGILLMGFTVSMLINVDLGMDSFTFFNLQLSRALGISYGTCTLFSSDTSPISSAGCGAKHFQQTSSHECRPARSSLLSRSLSFCSAADSI